MKIKLIAFAVIAALAPASVLASDVKNAPDEAQAARFLYEGFVGGIRVGEATADVALTSTAYAANLRLETAGMMGMFFSWRHLTAVQGVAGPDGGSPLEGGAYRNESVWKGKNRIIQVDYHDKVAEISNAEPHPVKDEGRPEIEAALRKDVLDPFSAIVALGRTLETTGSCNASYGVYDGRRRYQFVATDEGSATVDKSRYAPFGGETHVCSFVFERVAGFKEKDNGKPPTGGAAYLRRAEPYAPMMPVKVVVGTKYGNAILHLAEVERIDAELATLAAQKLGVTNPD